MFKVFKKIKRFKVLSLVLGTLVVLTGISTLIYFSVVSASSANSIGSSVKGIFGYTTIKVLDKTNNSLVAGVPVTLTGAWEDKKFISDQPCTTVTLTTDAGGIVNFKKPNDIKNWAKRTGLGGKETGRSSCVYTITTPAIGDKYAPTSLTKKWPQNKDESQNNKLDGLNILLPPPMTVSLTTNTNDQPVKTGSSFILTWKITNSDKTTTCTSGDNWKVAKRSVIGGKEQIKTQYPGTYTYSLSCTYPSSNPIKRTVSVQVTNDGKTPPIGINDNITVSGVIYFNNLPYTTASKLTFKFKDISGNDAKIDVKPTKEKYKVVIPNGRSVNVSLYNSKGKVYKDEFGFILNVSSDATKPEYNPNLLYCAIGCKPGQTF